LPGHASALDLNVQVITDAVTTAAAFLMAVGCYEALHELGIRIPDDTAVMGYDVERSLHLHRPLTAFTAAFRKGEALTLKSSSMQRLDLIKRPQHFIVEYPIAMRGSV
jgi:DNA-binding LacI/PurR family transcriptional regulator